jgi:tripartite-type tricarboxylate transporter receptor subunit TctC
MRSFAGVAAAVGGLLCAGPAASADRYPDRPIRFLVPSPPGGSPDILARIVGSKLSEQLGQQVIVDNRSGASGIIGIEIAKAAPPDGYTIVLATTTLFASLPALKPDLPFDPERDFAPLTRIAWVANVMAVSTGLGATSVADVVRIAKAKPGSINYGSAGNGTPAHLAGAMLDVLAGVRTTHVPYKGAAPALNDLLAGQLQMLITSPLVAMPHARGGRIRVLASTGAKPDPLLPELPTVAQTVPGYDITQWWGVAVPVKTPAAFQKRLHAEIVKALQMPETRELLAKQGATASPESPTEFAALMKAERARIAEIGKKANIILD